MTRLNQRGSHVVGVALLILAFGVVGFAGYKVSQAHKTTPVAQVTTKTAAAVPAKITTTADLKQAANALDNSSAQLSSGLNDQALNSDMNDML